MTRTGHRLVRGIAFAMAAAGAIWLLGNRPPVLLPAPPVVTIAVASAGPASSFPEPLFADPVADGAPGVRSSGPPQLLGIVGRLSDPLAMVRASDGSVLTIAKGQAAGGWTLTSVASDRATFRRGTEERVSVLPPRDGAE
jgi:hypothetical protein